MPRASSAALRPPLQARSRATLERLLAAAVGLLAERRFEEATVAEIARRGRASVGAFYARFADKDALLGFLNERLFEEGRGKWDAFLAPERWRGRGAAEIVAAVVGLMVRKRRPHRGLLRAMALYARSRPQPRFAQHAAELNRHVHLKLQRLLLLRRHEIAHPDPPRAIAFGLFLVDAATREAILFSDARLFPWRLSDAALARELTAAWLALLGVRPRRRR
jgi:AcrR family transcriptional regulator